MAQILQPPPFDLPSRPQTPPYTPMRTSKRPLTRTQSPASRASSIHPAETTSPDKSSTPRRSPDHIRVKILEDREAAQIPDGVSIHPDTSDSEDEDYAEDGAGAERQYDAEGEDENEDGSGSDCDGPGYESSGSETSSVTDKLSNLLATEKQGKKARKFHEGKTTRRAKKRESLLLPKRSHSKSAKSESGYIDEDARDDQTYTIRRLRRRTRGPDDDDFQFEVLDKNPLTINDAEAELDDKSTSLHVEHIGRL